jgi:RimJ/RimL family protein N-acetyltransferase
MELLRDGRSVEVRALQPADREGLVAAVRRVSAHSLYRRFFGVKREFSEQEIDFFANVDFARHVALVAVVAESGEETIIAGGRYISTTPGQAEVAFVVVDDYQGQGIGSALLRHLIAMARSTGLNQLNAEVLPDNTSMLRVFQKCGLRSHIRRDPHAVHIGLHLD